MSTIQNMGDDKLRDLFEESFDEQIGRFNNMSDSEIKVLHTDGDLSVEALFTGMAGSPSVADFKENKVKGADKVIVSYDGYDDMEFKLAPAKTVALNVNDYILVYELV